MVPPYIILLTNSMNLKEMPMIQQNKSSTSLFTNPSWNMENPQSQSQHLKKNEFCIWALSFPTQERYLALRMNLPGLIQSFREHTRLLGENWRMEPNDAKKNTMRLNKSSTNIYQLFIDSLVLMSESDYLDYIGFQFSFIESPDKICDLLAAIRNISLKSAHQKINQNKINKQKQTKYMSKSEWVHDAANQIESELKQKMNSKWCPKVLQQEKNRKKAFGNYWKNLSEEDRINCLYLGATDLKELIVNLLEIKISITPNELEAEVEEFLKIDRKDFCNKLLKWKLKKTSYSLCDYIELLFWKIREKINTNKFGNAGKLRKKRKRKSGNNTNQNKRLKSVDACSNDTNQTQMKQAKIVFDENQYTENKIQQDLLASVDQISEKANSYFQARVLAFERLSYILEMFGIKMKLYGSCACGIAIKNSDLDVALNEQILDCYEYLSTTHAKIQALFQFLESNLQAFGWIQIIKVIPTAYIPIMKFSIDTSVPFEFEGVHSDYFGYLNRSIRKYAVVQVDLTIETTQERSGLTHLGIISTKKSLQWMNEIPSLRFIVIALKSLLKKKGLNQTYYGGINTYTLMITIVSFVYHQKISKDALVSEVLERFLKFYGWNFDQKQYAIDFSEDSVESPQQNWIYVKKMNEESPQTMVAADLEIHDPLNDGKVMTKNCYKFGEIKQILRTVYNQCFCESRKQIKMEYFEQKSPQKLNKNDHQARSIRKNRFIKALDE